MLRAAEMKRLEALILERDVRAVTECLGRLGIVHLSRATASESGELLEPAAVEGQAERLRGLRERVGALCHLLEVGEDHPAAELPFASLDEMDQSLASLESELAELAERRKRLDTEIEAEYQALRDIEAFRPVDIPPEELSGLDFLHFAIGTLPARNLEAVREALGEKAVILPFRSPAGDQKLIALTSRTGRFALESVLEDNDFIPETLPATKGQPPSEAARKVRERLMALAREQEALRAATREVAAREGGRLAAYRQRLRVDEQFLSAQAYFGKTGSTCLITGYVPSRRVDAVREELLRATGGRVVVEVSDPAEDDPEVPTLMENPRLLRPFEMLVEGYGHPGYREIEPTLLVAIGFLLMFGMMFDDVGHGLALVASGLALARKATRDEMKNLGHLLWMSGCSAMVFGWVSGSIFGLEGAIRPPLGGWFEPLGSVANINRVLMAAIVLGVVVISLGVVLNIINRIRARDYFAVVFDRFGVVGFIFYWGAVGLGIRAVVSGSAPSLGEAVVLVGVPLVVLFFREPLHHLLTRRDHLRLPTLLGGLFEGFVEVLETLSTYVANTVSFVRVGAFALAHAAVCVAIFSTEAIVRKMPGGPLWSVLVVVFGNAFVIVLEGLVVSIQAMRLHYYEFFSKFFRGEGKAYEPFKLT